MPNTYACKLVSNPNVPIFLPRVCTLVLFILSGRHTDVAKRWVFFNTTRIYECAGPAKYIVATLPTQMKVAVAVAIPVFLINKVLILEVNQDHMYRVQEDTEYGY